MSESKSKPEVQKAPEPKAEKPVARCVVARCRKQAALSGLCESHWRSASGAG